MSTNSPRPPTSLPPSLRPSFEAICHRFAREWEESKSPRIEHFLDELKSSPVAPKASQTEIRQGDSPNDVAQTPVAAETRKYLASILLTLEIRLRTAAGELPTPAEYHERFPEYGSAVEDAFDDANRDLSWDCSDATRQEKIAEPDVQAIPQQLGRYEIRRELGKGGFGMVFLAHDTTLDRAVALKFARHSKFESQEHLSAFIREARTVAKLEHPTIVAVFDIKRFGDLVCIVQQYVEGVDLRQELKDGLPSYRRTGELCVAIADGIGFAHSRGFFHRDIKPANILIDRQGKPHIADFGLAIHESAQRRQRGERSGTPRYMPPEIVLGETHRMDGRSDIWSLGVMMYEMLTGHRAFFGSSLEEIFDEIQNRDPIPPRQHVPEIPAELERICLKCLSKRVVDRYSSAAGLVEDLNQWLNSGDDGEKATSSATTNLIPDTAPGNETLASAAHVTATHSTRELPTIIPRGLQSFDSYDAEFFLDLLPGPRDRHGFPDSIRFWRTRIGDCNNLENQGAGLIYGPSGCGKSSFVKAGLIPSLSEHIVPVYVEATCEGTESRLEAGIRQAIAGIPPDIPLTTILDSIRDGRWMPYGRKMLIVIDQFEQWLQDHDPSQLTELVRAIRHCDGRRLECLLMVRDDFWLATSRFMRAIEVDLLEGRNSTLIDLFDLQHAMNVLCKFGQAYGALPARTAELTKTQKRFLEQVVEGIAVQGKVVCVHLALFAAMFKDKPWTAAQLAKVGGPQGVGVKFLEDSFTSRTAKPEHVVHERAARKFLEALLPESGSDIRGNMLPATTLQRIAGYSNQDREFADLTRVLDQELRMVTLTDPLGLGEQAVTEDSAHYQLTHDFLVSPLREWLSLKKQSTMRGRAELRLAERCATWTHKPTPEYLPGILEFSNILTLTNRRNWSAQEAKMVRQASWIHGLRVATVAVALLAVGWLARSVYTNQRADNLVARLLEAKTADVVGIVAELDSIPRVQAQLETLQKEFASASRPATDQQQALRVSLARFSVDPNEAEFLLEQLKSAKADEAKAIIEVLSPKRENFSEQLWPELLSPATSSETMLRIATALAAWTPQDQRWAKATPRLFATLAKRNPLELNQWAELLLPIDDEMRRDAAEQIAIGTLDTTTLLSLFELYTDTATDSTATRRTLLQRMLEKSQPAELNWNERLLIGNVTAEDQAQRALYISLCERQANLAAAAIALDAATDRTWALLKADNNLTRRCFLIERLFDTGVDESDLWARLESETNPSIKAGILLALGRYVERYVDGDRGSNERVPDIEQLLLEDPNAEVHAAAQWLLGRHLQGQRKLAVSQRLRDTVRTNDPSAERSASENAKQWRVIGPAITMVRIETPGEFVFADGSQSTTSSGLPRRTRIEYSFEVSATEITQQQFREFAKGHDFGGYRGDFDLQGQLGDNHPVVNVTWYEAASFCNWLSAQAGIPEEQWCYTADLEFSNYPKPDGAYAMKLVEDWENKLGFRLPSEAEWQYACQAETLDAWNCGVDQQHLDLYAWYDVNIVNTADNRAVRECGLLKPNRFGLFDMHGNADERTSTAHTVRAANETVDTEKLFINKGGTAYEPARELTSLDFQRSLGSARSNFSGFRVVKRQAE